MISQGILTEGKERLSTVEPLIKVPCFVKNINNIFNKEADLN